jgi:hypothetical protein
MYFRQFLVVFCVLGLHLWLDPTLAEEEACAEDSSSCAAAEPPDTRPTSCATGESYLVGEGEVQGTCAEKKDEAMWEAHVDRDSDLEYQQGVCEVDGTKTFSSHTNLFSDGDGYYGLFGWCYAKAGACYKCTPNSPPEP